MNWKYRVLQAIGFLIPAGIAVAVFAWVEPMLNPSFKAVPLWVHLLITGAALVATIAIIAWAVRGGIPPRYHR